MSFITMKIVIPMYDLVLWPKNNPSFQKMECSEEKETKEEDESIIIDFDKSNKESFVKIRRPKTHRWYRLQCK